ncbi:PQQ-binding-like beta-propeller repeat protein [Nocardia sp. XZ_19_385]|uniref:outer membrane protein assembly factor BamB family protein n=1 Tax=Nocardia sp. XZ_19_385 TaxID=2769488 RepID=UPI00188DC9E5|nr:PQQ-binding-like beta-propeller repeat protein [Nocardia sp. XZ_19_385]
MRLSGWKNLRVVIVLGLLAALAGCSDSNSATVGTPDAPILDLGGIRKLAVGPHDDIKPTANGLYVVADGELRGIDPLSGERRWTVRREGLRPDPKRIYQADYGKVLQVSWLDTPGQIAYAADTGRELWRTDSEWFELDTKGGRFIRNDPHTGVRAWDLDYTALGCAAGLPEDSMYVFESREAALFRCPVKPGPENFEGEQLIGGLTLDTGALIWKRTVPDRRSFARSTNTLAIVTSGDTREVIESGTGRVLGSRAKSAAEWQFTMPDAATLIMDSSTVKDNKDFRLEEADGRVRWRAPFPETEEILLGNGTGNVVLATMRKRLGNYDCWLLAYDLATGERTVVAGPGATGQGEKPAFEATLQQGMIGPPSPWGVLIKLKDGEFAVIPAE